MMNYSDVLWLLYREGSVKNCHLRAIESNIKESRESGEIGGSHFEFVADSPFDVLMGRRSQTFFIFDI